MKLNQPNYQFVLSILLMWGFGVLGRRRRRARPARARSTTRSPAFTAARTRTSQRMVSLMRHAPGRCVSVQDTCRGGRTREHGGSSVLRHRERQGSRVDTPPASPVPGRRRLRTPPLDAGRITWRRPGSEHYLRPGDGPGRRAPDAPPSRCERDQARLGGTLPFQGEAWPHVLFVSPALRRSGHAHQVGTRRRCSRAAATAAPASAAAPQTTTSSSRASGRRTRGACLQRELARRHRHRRERQRVRHTALGHRQVRQRRHVGL